MPILKQEDDIHPVDLLDRPEYLVEKEQSGSQWWCVYTVSRREKDLMRKLAKKDISFYGPVISKRYRSPNGRLRNSFIPLFANYVFVLADEAERTEMLKTNCVSKCSPVVDQELLVKQLQQIHHVIKAGVPLTVEAKLTTGDRVKVKRGPFAGYEGIVIRREAKTRLLLSIQFLEKGVSMEVDEAVLEPAG
jgi:transcriptional antiterminator RfaH